MDYIPGSKMPVWVTAVERYDRLEKLGLARPGKRTPQAFIPRDAEFHPFLSKLWRFAAQQKAYLRAQEHEEEERIFFKYVDLWLAGDPDFENEYGLWELTSEPQNPCLVSHEVRAKV